MNFQKLKIILTNRNMSKQNLQIRNFITPGDILAVLVIIAGLVVALYFEEIAIRIIGVCISILGAVFLFILISQRISDVVESRFPKTGTPPPDFKVTTTKDSSAKRQQVEDFGQSFGDDEDFPVTPPVITKHETTAENKSSQIKQEAKSNLSDEHGFNDGFSGMRIVGKIKPTYKDAPVAATSPAMQKTEINEPANPIASKQPEIESSKIAEPALPIRREQKITQIDTEEKAPQPRQIPLISEEKETVQKYTGKVVDLPMNVFIETDQLLGDEPRKEFEYFMTRVLMIIRSATDTRTALFMLFNSHTDELILESYVTSVPLAIKSKLRFNLGTDIVSQIISNAKPQILSEINPAAELDLIPYYNTVTSTGSLIGVPVFWGDGIVGVLIADSESKNAYDAATVAFLGHFTKLVGALVKSYTNKYELLQASKTLEAITTFHGISVNSRNGSENISESITESLKLLFPNSSNGTCGFDAESDNWKVLSYKGSGKDCVNQIISLEESLIGDCIYQCKTIHLKQGEKSSVPRVIAGELSLSGEFVCVPIKSKTQIYGAIFLESANRDTFTDFDISVLELIGDQAGNSIEKLYLMSSLNSSALFDANTGLLNPNALYRRLQEEISRAKDLKTDMALCLFRFDKYATLDPENYPNRFEYTMQIILERVKRYIQNYDLYGQVDDNTYGIVFLGKDATKSRMTAERIRADVANTIIEHGGGSYSITISMGMASPSKEFDLDVLIRDSFLGLDRASEAGNQVQIIY